MPRPRLTALDASFLRVETPTAHMHVGWKGICRAGDRPVTLERLRRSIAARLQHAPRFRQRLAFPVAGLGEPRWVDDEAFDLTRHVVAMDGVRDRAAFDARCDDCLSRPLNRDHPLWRVEIAPSMADGTVGLVMKVHHAMVDGKSAVELALLLLDLTPDAEPAEPAPWSPAPPPGTARLALETLADTGVESLRAARGAARMAVSPGRGLRMADTLRRAALAVGEDVLRPAPSSYVNVPITARRTLVHHTAPMAPFLAAKERQRVTLNDLALTVVTGALRELALVAKQVPRPLKVMVPVSTRRPEQTTDLGNRISFVFVELPVHLRRPADRLAHIWAATSQFKREGRANSSEAVLGALGVLPEPLKDAASRFAASPRMYNLTVSNVPGPRVPVYLLGAEVVEAAPVIPLPDGHALSIGVFTYRDRITFSGYADPTALRGVDRLPAALNAAVLGLAGLADLDRLLHPGVDGADDPVGARRPQGALVGAGALDLRGELRGAG